MKTHAIELILEPGEQLPPAAAQVRVRVDGAHGQRGAAHHAHQ